MSVYFVPVREQNRGNVGDIFWIRPTKDKDETK